MQEMQIVGNPMKFYNFLGTQREWYKIPLWSLECHQLLVDSPVFTTSLRSRLTLQLNTMVDCGPACAVPSCASAPTVGFGACGPRGLGWGYGYGLGYGYGRGLGYGYGAGALAESSGSLGTLAGVHPSCINQVPPSEVTIQPPAVVVTIPGPILSASCEPVAVGGNTPCAIGGFGRFGGGYFGGRLGRLGRRGSLSSLGRRGSICALPCNLPC